MIRLALALLLFAFPFSIRCQSLNLDSLETEIKAKQQALIKTQFSFQELATLTGKKITPKDLLGKVVLYNFWFTSCPPCVAELPALNELKKQYANVVCIAITFEPKEDVLSFMKKHPFDFEMVTLSRQDIEKKINFGYPTTIIVDKSGAITYVESGGPLNPDQATEAIRQKVKPKIEEALHY